MVEGGRDIMGVAASLSSTCEGKCYTVKTIVTKQVTQIQQEVLTEFVKDGVVVEKKQEVVGVVVLIMGGVLYATYFSCFVERGRPTGHLAA